MNLTDAEIIKALECCADGGNRCDECPYGIGDCLDDEDRSILLVDALDLINRQKAEIERWRANYTLPKEGFFNVLCGALVYTKTLKEYNQFRRTIKTEAIKEFAEKIDYLVGTNNGVSNRAYRKISKDIKNLVKEMVGE